MNSHPLPIAREARANLRPTAVPLALSALALLGCATPSRPQVAAGATPLGAPHPAVRPELIDRIDPAVPPSPALRLPERIALPATYRALLLDGHWALVKENDPQALAAAPTSLRIVTGEIARGELAYQPALLPQELAAEVAASRESAARMDDALAGVMQRSRELSVQTERLEAQTRALAALLAAAPRPTAAAPTPAPAAAAADGTESKK